MNVELLLSNMNVDALKVKKTILSCKTLEQLEICHKLINLFENKWKWDVVNLTQREMLCGYIGFLVGVRSVCELNINKNV
jgi:hypothetical protein